MNFSAPFIERPIATSLLMVALILLGLTAFSLLPISALPQVDIPTINVFASLPGASAQTMASTVTAPIERQLALISGITEMTSSSSEGDTSITLQFDIDRSIDAAAQDVSAALNAAQGVLPHDLPGPPGYEKANPADFLIMSLEVSSDGLPISQVDLYADTYMAQQLSRVRGVGLIDLHGEQKPAVRVQVDPAKVAALGLSLEQVRTALNLATSSSAKGTLENAARTITLETTDQLTKARDYENVIIAYRKGAPVRVRDIGRAVDSVEDIKQAAWSGTKRAVILDIHKQFGFNVAETVDAIKAALPGLESALPSSIHVKILSDRTQTIRASIKDMERTFIWTVGLVVLVVLYFLRSLWATVICSAAIPLSVIGTFGLMYLLGYSVNNISLMGLTIAVGFVIDDAVVMIENIIRKLEEGETPLQAALKGAKQIFFTIVSMTASLVAVFLPLLLMGGVVGRSFRQFSVTVSGALLVSALVSLTLTPAMCRVFLKKDKAQDGGKLSQLAEKGYTAMFRGYERTLGLALRHRRVTLAVVLVVAAITTALYWAIPKGFYPQQDTGIIYESTETTPDVSVEAMGKLQLQVADRLRGDPAVADVYSWIYGDGGSARAVIALKPFNARDRMDKVLERLQAKTKNISNVLVHYMPRQELTIGARLSKTQFQYTLEDANTPELYANVPKIMKILQGLPQLRDVAGDIQAAAPQTTVVIDRDAAGRFGVTPQEIDNTLYDAFGQRQVATIMTELDQYHVVLEADPAYRLDKSALDNIYIPTDQGRMIPLSVVSHFADSTAPLSINHQGQFPSVTLSFNLAPGFALGDGVTAVEKALAKAGLPPALHGSFQGTALAFKATLANQPYLIAAAIIAVYIVLGILYESYIHPITILSTIPSAGLGALLALMAFHYELTVISLVGIILLIGIVKKNAIMMIDFALEAERKLGLDAETAIHRACLLRFRPIMMTTAAALLGSLPLALGHGAGSELRAPLGVAIVGGLMVSQVLTLYTTPVIYLYLHRFTKVKPNAKAPLPEKSLQTVAS